MLSSGIIAAFCEKRTEIDKIHGGDTVFIYGNKQGILAYGQANGVVLHRDRVEPKSREYVRNGCHYQKLSGFRIVHPVPASKIKEILERTIPFNQTLIHLPDGQKLLTALEQQG